MNLGIGIIIAIAIACVGTIIGVSMVAVDKDKYIKAQATNSPIPYKPPSRQKLFLPMMLTIGFSLSWMVLSYQTGNIILFISGFLFLFIGFGMLGVFLMSK